MCGMPFDAETAGELEESCGEETAVACGGAETTLAQMRLVLGRCGAGLDELPADAAGELLKRGDRPLMLRQVSRGLRAVVAAGKLPLAYVLDHHKVDASTSTDKLGDIMGDLELKCTEFDVVSISVCRLFEGFHDATRLGTILPRCPHLTSLDLSQNAIQMHTLAAGLASCTALTALSLDGNTTRASRLRAAGTRLLCDALHCPGLAELRLHCCGVEDAPGEDGAMQSLTQALLKSPALRHVDVSTNYFIGEDFARLLAPALPRMAMLTVLNLSFNYLEGVGLTALGAVLPRCAALTELDVRACMKTHHDAAEGSTWAFASGLAGCPSLATLRLGHNDFGALVTEVLQTLPLCSALTELDLALGMHLDRAQQAVFVGTLPQCAGLSRLGLDINEFETTTHNGTSQLPAALEQCRSLRELVMYSDALDRPTTRALDAGWRYLEVTHTWIRRQAAP